MTIIYGNVRIYKTYNCKTKIIQQDNMAILQNTILKKMKKRIV